jgi:hypothetical protein
VLKYLVLELKGVELEDYDIDPDYKNYRLTYSKQ